MSNYDEQVEICEAFNRRERHRELYRQQAYKEGAEAMRQLCMKAFASIGDAKLSGASIVQVLGGFGLPFRLFDVDLTTPADFAPDGQCPAQEVAE